MADYAVDFRTLAAPLGWNTLAHKAAFLNGLSERLKDELASRDKPQDLEDVIELVVQVDDRLRERARERRSQAPPQVLQLAAPAAITFPRPRPVPSESQSADEPLQLDNTKLTPEERDRRMWAK